jgi:hypothetical protein
MLSLEAVKETMDEVSQANRWRFKRVPKGMERDEAWMKEIRGHE